jgi:predicted TIM-barrel fold metal-dependent hydrolase
MATALWALNQAACGSDPAAEASSECFAIDDGMLEDEAQARQALSGDEFIFDVQTHVSDPLSPFESDDPPARALDFITEIYVQSDTAVACVTGTPAARQQGVGGVQARTLLSELIERHWGPRLLLHANAEPENGASELDYMSEVAESYSVSAWKTYPFEGERRLDSDEMGGPFFERARRLGVNVVAAHRGLSGGGGYTAAGSPLDVVRAAAVAPDIKFLVYHSGWEASHDENHAYDPNNDNPQGVDRLIRALADTRIGPGGNVYAELGTTWFNLMSNPEQAAHVLGKLLLHLGSERILWGTDCVFNGVPQSQIVAFRRFEIPVAMQEQFGYPALTAAARAQIFGLNGAEVYGVDPSAVRFAIEGDEVGCLRSAYLDDRRAVPTPDPRRYEGPRTRREFLAFAAREKHERDSARRRLVT